VIQVLISNRIYLYAKGLERLLDADEGFQVTGLACEEEDLEALEEMAPDIVISDVASFPLVADRGMKILLIWDSPRALPPFADLKSMVEQGLAGILDARIDPPLLRKAIETVYAGDLWFDHKIITNTLCATHDESRQVPVSRREAEILQHICDGCSNKEIADKLCISEQTVKTHCSRLFKKFGVSSRLQLALHAAP